VVFPSKIASEEAAACSITKLLKQFQKQNYLIVSPISGMTKGQTILGKVDEPAWVGADLLKKCRK